MRRLNNLFAGGSGSGADADARSVAGLGGCLGRPGSLEWSIWAAALCCAAALVALVALVAIAAIVAAPLLAGQGRVESLVLYKAFAPFCHQQADRCWTLAGYPLAVCVRCFGVWIGFLAGGLFRPRFSRRFLYASLAVFAASWALEAAGLAAPPSELRWLSGALLGAAAAPALLDRRSSARPVLA